jgi:hypothetical protein
MARAAWCCICRRRWRDGEADEPEGEQVAAVEVVVEEGGELEQEVVGEEMGLVEDEDGLDVLLVDEVQQGALEVQSRADCGGDAGLQAELAGEGAVDAGRFEGRVAEVEHAVARARELGAEVADGGGLAGAGVADEDAETWLIGQPAKEAGEAGEVVALVVEGRAAGVARERRV